jgi:beta-N-acetylhexosaminidase
MKWRAAQGGLLAALALLLAACGSSSTRALRALPTATATPAVPAKPAPPPPDYHLLLANETISRMTLDQELGQIFVVAYQYTDANEPSLTRMITEMGAGGVIIYPGFNVVSIAQTKALTDAMQAAAPIPLIIGADEEGGGDEQLGQIFPPHMAAYQIGATGDPKVAAQQADIIAGQLKQLGINADFAPIVDVEAPDRIWTRAFGHDPQMVTRLGIAQVDAYQNDGIIACPKHFPGLGGADSNPHFSLPVINFSKDYLEAHDWVPYRALLSHHPGMIMTTDLLMPALDPVMPAELSQPIVTGILRNEIGYDGVVITDALYMEGITAHYSMAQAGVLAIQAGNDMLEGLAGPDQMRVMVDALRQAVDSGQISKARIDQSVRRILLLKMQYGLFHLPIPRGEQRAGMLVSAAPGLFVAAPGVGLLPDPRRRMPRGG